MKIRIEEIICGGDFSKEILIGYFKTRGVNIDKIVAVRRRI